MLQNVLSKRFGIQKFDYEKRVPKRYKQTFPQRKQNVYTTFFVSWVRLIISASEVFEMNPSTECKTSVDETCIAMLGLDVVQCSTHDRVTTHKHASLAISVRHLTGSKQLIKIINQDGALLFLR